MKIIAITPNLKRDYTTEMILEGLIDLDVEIIASDSGNGITRSHSDHEILKINDANFVLAFFGKINGNKSPRYHLLNDLKKKYQIGYVDGSEWTFTGHKNKNQDIESLNDYKKRRGEPWIHESMFGLSKKYFKRECYPEDATRGIIPLPFCLSKRHILQDVHEKDIDLMCVFGHTQTGLRKQLMEYCQDLKSKTNYKIVVSDRLDHAEYLNNLKRSRIVIDSWGGGDNCDRFYEAIGAKACCLYQAYNTIIENPFIDNEHAISFENIEMFSNRLENLLTSKEKTKTIGEKGYEHALKYHTSIVRAKTIIENMV